MRDCRVLRVFVRDEEGGNPLGVVTDPAGLDGAAMQGIATELGYSETVFLDCTRPVPMARIFTPGAEIPFAGHPLVGAAWVLGAMGPWRRLACGIGEVPFRVEGDRTWIEVAISRDLEEVAPGVAAGTGLPSPTRAWMVRLPLRYLVLEAGTRELVGAARPDFERLAVEPWEGTLLFARATGRVKARFFAPAVGVPEDPATGSAAVALASALVFAGEPEGSLLIEQGDEVGAPSRISLQWGGGLVSVGGAVRPAGLRWLER